MSGAPSRVDASGSRLSSLRGSSADAGGSARRPKFVPKAAKRRSGGDAPAAEAHEDAKSGSTAAARPLRGEFPRGDRARAGRGEGGRGARGGRGGRGGRGRGSLPTGKVTFVGTLSGGSSYSAGAATPAPRPASYAAADGLGISVLDDEDHEILPGDMQADEPMEEQWPPVVKSVMEPMSLPLPRRPEPRHTGDVFCDENGQMTLHDDSLLFIQFPTTLPLANATTSSASKSEDDKMDGSGASRSDDAATSGKQEEGAVKFTTGERFDGSIATAPGGFIGKLCIHKSGKTVLVIGDKQFDVATAQTPSVCEDVYSINPEEQQLFVLGGVERHLVVTPDFDALLA